MSKVHLAVHSDWGFVQNTLQGSTHVMDITQCITNNAEFEDDHIGEHVWFMTGTPQCSYDMIY